MRADVILGATSSPQQYNGGGVNYVFQKEGSPNTYYKIYVDTALDVVWSKSDDGGLTWTNPTNVFTGTVVALSSWCNRCSGIADDIVHIAYTESTGGDVLYRSLNMANDTLGTQTTIFNGASSAAGGCLTICMDRGGHLRCMGSIDNGTETFVASSTDNGATWTDTISSTNAMEGATQDQVFLFPGYNADNHDMMAVFVDASANGLSLKRYDDSADSWSESAIIADGSFVDGTAANGFPHVSGFTDLANNRNVIGAWTGVDTANADLRCFILTDSAITETSTNIVLNSTDDQGLCAMALDTIRGTWYAFYAGKSDGSENWPTAMNIYYKTSNDAGATWSAETQLSKLIHGTTQYLATTPRFAGNFLTVWLADQAADILVTSVNLPQARARVALGVN